MRTAIKLDKTLLSKANITWKQNTLQSKMCNSVIAITLKDEKWLLFAAGVLLLKLILSSITDVSTGPDNS